MITMDSDNDSGYGGSNRHGVAGGPAEEKHDAVIDLGSVDTESLLMEQVKDQRYVNVNKLSSREMKCLIALCDTFLPSVEVPDDPFGTADEATVKFFKTSAAKTATPERVAGMISQMMGYRHAFLLRLGLILLSTWIGTLIFCGVASISCSFPFFHKFSELNLKKRQQIALSWPSGMITRMLFAAIKSLILLAFFTEVDDNNQNPSWEAIGYCGPDPDFKSQSKANTQPSKGFTDDQEEDTFGPLHKGLVNMSNPKEMVAKTLRLSGFKVSVHRSSPGPHTIANPSMTIRCDAVVVGSGSGGGVVAGTLANAGYKVLVIEKGTYLARGNLSLLEGQSLNQMYEAGGIISTQDVGVMVLAGSTVGGGSTVNWSASIKTPSHVIREWSESYELELFDSEMYREALDIVSQKMGVQSDISDEGLNNKALRKGCKELGYPVHTIPRNSPQDHHCGWCFMGCKDGRKKGTAETWLRDLVESNNGVILPRCEATRVLYSKGGRGRRGKARGVAFEFGCDGAREVCVVEAKVTVVACGALNTPVLLRKSGLKNPNIGKNLHLHPVVMAWGVFPEEGEKGSTGAEDGCLWRPEKGKRSYEGGIMTAMSPVVANFETSGYGALIQTPSLHPGLFSALMTWTSGIDIKIRMTKFSRTAHLIALARDVGSGEIVSQDPTDIQYELAAVDETNLKRGLEKMLRIMAAAGAEEIGTHHWSGPRINVKKASCREFESFVKRVSKMRLYHSAPLASAHQMGSCRMGAEPRTSVVDQRGETWEVEGLFLADTSVFPTALGVNPMVTAMAISYCTSQAVLEVLKRKRNRR